MSLFQNKGWFLGIVAFVALFTMSSMVLSDKLNDESGMIQLSELTDADIDTILAVKAEMQTAQIQSN